MTQDLTKLFAVFLQGYDVEKKDAIWTSHSQKFRTFWNGRIIAGGEGELEDPEIDEIVRVLDRNGKGNTKDTEAVARVMRAAHRNYSQRESEQAQRVWQAGQDPGSGKPNRDPL